MYSIKLESLKEMYKFHDLYDTPELNQDYLSNLNRPVTSVHKEEVIKTSHPKKAQGQMYSTQNSSITSKNNKCQCSLNYSNKIETKGTLSDSFNEATITHDISQVTLHRCVICEMKTL